MRLNERSNFIIGFCPLLDGEGGGGSGSGGSGSGSGSGGSGNGSSGADGEVAKAYEKLRQAESERDAKDKELKDIKRNQLPEVDRLKQENEDLKTRNTALESDKTDLSKKLRVGAVERIARDKNFADPEVAVALLNQRGADYSDDAKAGKALDELATAKPGLTTTPPPSGGPVNQNTGGEGTEPANQAINAEIRSRAGRPTSTM